MAEAGEGPGQKTGPTRGEKSPNGETKAEKGPDAVGKAARLLVDLKARSTFTDERKADMRDPGDRALRLTQIVLEEDTPNWKFDGDPDITMSLRYGDISIKNGRLAGIKGGDEDTVTCYFRDKDGNKINNADGDWAGVSIPREHIADLSIRAYGEELTGMFEGADKAKLQDHLTYINAGDKADTLMTMDEAQTAAKLIVGDKPEVQDKLKALDGRTVLSHDEFSDFLGGAQSIDIGDKDIKAYREWRENSNLAKAAEEARDKAEIDKDEGKKNEKEKERIQANVRQQEAYAQFEVLKKAKNALNEKIKTDAGEPATSAADLADTPGSVERGDENLNQVEQTIRNQKNDILSDISQMEQNATDNEGNTDSALKNNPEYKRLLYLHSVMENAEDANGDFGPIVRAGALELVRTRGGVTQMEVDRVLKLDSDFSKEVAKAKEEATKFFNDKEELSPAQRKQFSEALKNPAQFCDLLLSNKAMADMSGEITAKIYGNLGDEAVDRLFQNIIDTNHGLNSKTIGKIERLKDYSKKAGLVALILAAVPVAAAAFATAAAAQAIEGAAKAA